MAAEVLERCSPEIFQPAELFPLFPQHTQPWLAQVSAGSFMSPVLPPGPGGALGMCNNSNGGLCAGRGCVHEVCAVRQRRHVLRLLFFARAFTHKP